MAFDPGGIIRSVATDGAVFDGDFGAVEEAGAAPSVVFSDNGISQCQRALVVDAAAKFCPDRLDSAFRQADGFRMEWDHAEFFGRYTAVPDCEARD